MVRSTVEALKALKTVDQVARLREIKREDVR
jgi:ribosomal protein S5